MKTSLLLLASLLILVSNTSAQTSPATEKQALARQLNQLLRDPRKPSQDVKLELSGCHVQQTIRDTDADVRMSQPVAVSVSKGSSDWSVNLDNGRFELKMGFDWQDVTALTYAPDTDDDGHRSYELRVKRQAKNSSTTTTMTLYTTDEAAVKELVRRLEQLRQSCR
jgi:opacity protein-like surface antigen